VQSADGTGARQDEEKVAEANNPPKEPVATVKEQ
jgi:hypothetical protein